MKNEFIKSTDERIATGPKIVSVESVLDDNNLMMVKLPNGDKLELKGTDFANVVKKVQSK